MSLNKSSKPITNALGGKSIIGAPLDGDTLRFDEGSKAWRYVVAGTGDVVDGANLGAGAKVFKDKESQVLFFRTLIGMDGINIEEEFLDIIIRANAAIMVQSFPSLNIKNSEFITFGGEANFDGVRANRLIVMPRAGTLRNFTVFVNTNNTTGTPADLIVEKNTGITTLRIQFPLGPASGVFQDDVNTVEVAQGDLIDVAAFTASGGDINISAISIELI